MEGSYGHLTSLNPRGLCVVAWCSGAPCWHLPAARKAAGNCRRWCLFLGPHPSCTSSSEWNHQSMQICGYRSNSLLAHLCTIDQAKRKIKLGFSFPWCPDHCFGKWWGSCSYSCCLWKRSPNLCVILPWKTDFSISVFSCILYVCLKKCLLNPSGIYD